MYVQYEESFCQKSFNLDVQQLVDIGRIEYYCLKVGDFCLGFNVFVYNVVVSGCLLLVIGYYNLNC